MSGEPPDAGWGGPGDTDGLDETGSDGGGTGSDGGGSIISWSAVKGVLPGLRDFLKAFPLIGSATVALLLGEEGQPDDPGLLTDPIAFIVDVIEDWIIDSLITPLLDFVVNLFASVADSLLYVAFGTDRTFGVYTHIGVVDVPMYIMSLIIGAYDPAGSAVLGVMGDVNQAIASVAAEAGIAAPVILPLLWLAWVGLVVYVAWTLISALDIPLVRLVPLINRLLAPVRGFFRRFR